MTEQNELNNKGTATQKKTFAQAVEQHIPSTTGLISDLDYFYATEPLVERVGKKGQDDEFKYDALVRDGQFYRIPPSVYGTVQLLQEKRMDEGKEPYKAFQVFKTGTKRDDTKYQTIPYFEESKS